MEMKPRNMMDSERIIMLYMRSYIRSQSRRYSRTREAARKIMSGDYGEPTTDMYDALLSPLLISWDDVNKEKVRLDKISRTTLTPVMIALSNKACPHHYLAFAAGCLNHDYRFAARNNPNCPEEYEVYVALWGR